MAATIIDGKAIAQTIEREVAEDVARLSYRPRLVAVRVGSDPASEVYVRNKARKARELGLDGEERVFPETLSEGDLLAEVGRLNADQGVDGILVQLPLPSHIDSGRIVDSIDPAKDVDGFHPLNVGRLHLGRQALLPCTPAGVVHMLEASGAAIEGSRAVVIGRSDIVGKPLAALLLQRNATVTICHSRTKDLAEITRSADVLIAAIGRPLFVTAEMVSPGAVVIDVGINRIEAPTPKGSALVGDVDFARVREVASMITPVPGGVGPMTIAMLMRNTLTAARWRRQ